MKQKYKITAIIISLFIAFCPLLTNGFISYASNVPGGSGGEWDPIETHEDIVAAFKAYCQTTGLNTEHVPNTVNAIVKWDYSQLEKYAALANVDLEGLNAHIWYQIKQNKPLKFYFDSTGITSCQKIYALIVSDNNLQPNSSKLDYSGKFFVDDDGNDCFCYTSTYGSTYYESSDISQFKTVVKGGTPYRFIGRAFYLTHDEGNYQYVLNENNNSYNYNIRVNKNHSGISGRISDFCKLTLNADAGTSFNQIFSFYMNTSLYYNYVDGCVCIIYNPNTRKYYLGSYMQCTRLNNGVEEPYIVLNPLQELANATGDNASITYNQGEPINHPQDKGMEVKTGDTTINNYITNNNTNITYNYDDNNEPPSSLTPLPPTPNYPTGGTQDPDGNFNWTMPDLDIDFHINSDISNIFPFSIPFDIIHFFDIFDSEPVTPEVDTTFEICNIEIPLQFDLHWLDDTAAYFRAFVLAIYCFGLAIATRALFHIY